MVKNFIKSTINRILSPLDMILIKKYELRPDASALRKRLFTQLKDIGFNPAHIIDVGAHEAEWSSDAIKFFPDCTFTLVEPQIEMKPFLDKFCAGAKNARWILGGAGAHDGELTFTVARESDSSSFALSEEKAKTIGIDTRVLPLYTVDTICEKYKLPVPEIIKIDAEGLDIDVINGAQKMIGKTEIFFIEIPMFDYWENQSFHIIVNKMKELGYEPYDITDLNRRKHDDALALIEMAFAKKDGILRKYHGW